jgi:hypothetical protein
MMDILTQFSRNTDVEAQLDTETFEVDTPIPVDGGTIEPGTTLRGYLRADRNETDVSRQWVIDYYAQHGRYPAVQFDEREYLLLNADLFDKSDEYLVFVPLTEGDN